MARAHESHGETGSLRPDQATMAEIEINALRNVARGEAVDDAPLSDLISRGYVTRHQIIGETYYVVTNAGWELLYYKY